MRCGIDSGQVKSSGKYPCGVCRKGVGRNSIMCSKCRKWIHKKCSKIKGRLRQDPEYKCPVCTEKNQCEKTTEDNVQIKVKADVVVIGVSSFCYLGDVRCKPEVGRRKQSEIE